MPGKPIALPTTLQPRDEERFWLKVRKTETCWLWQDKCSPYGKFGVGTGPKYRAHRLAYALAYGVFDWALLVCHTCDTPACVNPAHLFLGASIDNNQDAQRKGRHAHGARHGRALLSAGDVRAIRRDLARGATEREVARRYGVSIPAIGRIKRGLNWRSLGSDPAQERRIRDVAARRRFGEAQSNAKLDERSVRLLRERYLAGGVSQKALAREFGVDQALVSRIVRQKRWRHVP